MTLPLREFGKSSINQDQDEGISMTTTSAQPESERFSGLKSRWHGASPLLSSSLPSRAFWGLTETLIDSEQSGFDWSDWGRDMGEMREVREGVCCGGDGYGG